MERYPILYFVFPGSPDPTARNKDKFGRLRSVCHSIMSSIEPRARTKTNKMENSENKNLQNRREFFREAAKKALPILGAVALLSNPVIAGAMESEPVGCNGCYDYCQKGCKSGCEGRCKDHCALSCSESCRNTCRGGCDNTCKEYVR